MTKGRSNCILLGPADDLPYRPAASLEWTWIHSQLPGDFLEMLLYLSFKKKPSLSLRKSITSISILLRPMHASLVLWANETAPSAHGPLVVPTWRMVSPGGAWGEFSISNVVGAVIPDLMLGPLQNANSF